jgi:hypothetical protein
MKTTTKHNYIYCVTTRCYRRAKANVIFYLTTHNKANLVYFITDKRTDRRITKRNRKLKFTINKIRNYNALAYVRRIVMRRILKSDARWRSVVIVTPLVALHRGKKCRYPLNRRFCGLLSRFDLSEKRKTSSLCPEQALISFSPSNCIIGNPLSSKKPKTKYESNMQTERGKRVRE